MTSQSRSVTFRLMPSLMMASALVLTMSATAGAQVTVRAVKPAPIRAAALSNPQQRRLTITNTRPRTTNAQSQDFESEVRSSQLESQQQRRPSLASLARTLTTAPSKPKAAPLNVAPLAKTAAHR